MADPNTAVKIFNISKSDESDLVTEVFTSKTVVMGSPTVANNVLHSVAGFVHLLKQLKFKDKKAATFGCYGWSGESVKMMNELMKSAGFDILSEGLRNQWNSSLDGQQSAIEFGKEIARS